MKKNVILLPLIVIGLVFQSCQNGKSKNSDAVKQEQIKNTFEKEATTDSGVDTNTIDDPLAEKIKTYLNETFLTEGDKRAISEAQRKFQYDKVDLNNDGEEEVFVNLPSSYFCGTGGCTILLLDHKLDLITRFSPTRTLYVQNKTQNGWQVLATKTEGKWRNLIYKNGAYPSNPTLLKTADAAPSANAQILFNEDANNIKTYRF